MHTDHSRPHRFRLPASLLILLAVNVLLQIINLVGTVPRPNGADGQGYMSWGEALLGHGNWDPAPFLQNNRWYRYYQINGRYILMDKYPAGWCFATLPAMAVGQGLSVLTNRLGVTHYPLDGNSPVLIRSAWVGVYIWIHIGLICAYFAMAELTSERAAKWAIWLAWLGTSAFAYTWRWPYMSHGPDMSVLSILFLMALRIASRERSGFFTLFFFGVLASLLVCIRTLDILYLLPIATIVLFTGQKLSMERIARIIAIGLLGVMPLFFMQTFIWKRVFGMWYFNGYAFGGEGFAVNWWHLFLLLFSSFHGLFLMHPITLLAFAGLIVLLRNPVALPRDKTLALSVLATLIITIFVYGFWSDWSLGDSFGARWACDLFIYWSLGLAFLWERTGFNRALLTVALIFAIYSAIIVGGMAMSRVERAGRLHVYIPGKGWRLFPI